ncbi:MAG: polysaccharide biosynthesis protein [Candidatus Thorarchaeota archaeon]|nr:polysaccharide biosynthesis protein [Candidatus Thorarchaeota archaeon]
MPKKTRVLIAGAGDGGKYALQELKSRHSEKVEIVGFVDDSAALQGYKIENVKVIGTTFDIERLASELGFDDVVIAMPSAHGAVVKRIRNMCETAGVECRILPGVYDILTGESRVTSSIREVRFEDLVKRDPIKTNRNEVVSYLQGAVVFVTGAAGSIGSEIVDQVAHLKPRTLVLIDRSENGMAELLWNLEMDELRNLVVPVIADLQDEKRIDDLFSEYSPDVVFHAAAFKHVNFMEMYPEESVKNNILASDCLFRIALEHKTKRLITISTDKAVNPTCVMGASKRFVELLMEEYARRSKYTKLSAVRFGNVFDSEGSVVRLFRKQIENGGPITITHPEVERFFMSVSEAAHLVIQAGALSQNGAIYVLKMGDQVKILDIAQEMCRIYGYDPDHQIQFVITGLKNGEKLSEELIGSGEVIESTSSEYILKITNKRRSNWTDMESDIQALAKYAECSDRTSIITMLKKIIPEYNPAANDSC